MPKSSSANRGFAAGRGQFSPAGGGAVFLNLPGGRVFLNQQPSDKRIDLINKRIKEYSSMSKAQLVDFGAKSSGIDSMTNLRKLSKDELVAKIIAHDLERNKIGG